VELPSREKGRRGEKGRKKKKRGREEIEEDRKTSYRLSFFSGILCSSAPSLR